MKEKFSFSDYLMFMHHYNLVEFNLLVFQLNLCTPALIICVNNDGCRKMNIFQYIRLRFLKTINSEAFKNEFKMPREYSDLYKAFELYLKLNRVKNEK